MFTFVDEEKAKAYWEEELIAKGEQRGRLEGIQEGRQEGVQIGVQKERINTIRIIMQSLKMTANQAMEFLHIPQAERAILAEML